MARKKVGHSEKTGHNRTFTCGILVSWKTAGARAKPKPNSERPPGHENLAAFLFPYHGPGHRTAGAFLLSHCPAALYTSAAGWPKHPFALGHLCRGWPRASLVNLHPPFPLWVLPGKRRIAGQVKSDDFSQKMRKNRGVSLRFFEKRRRHTP